MARPIPYGVSRVQLLKHKVVQLTSRGTGNNGKLASERESHDVMVMLVGGDVYQDRMNRVLRQRNRGTELD
jgi:uncharacterized protein (DUF4415 family)